MYFFRSKTKTLLIFFVFLCIAICVLLFSCEAKKEIKNLGEKVDGCTSLCIVNQSGKNILSFSIKTSNNLDTKMLEEGDVFVSDEERMLNYVLSDDKSSSVNSDVVVPIEYTINIVYEDNSTFSIHGFPFTDTDKVSIKLKDNITYIEYYSKCNEKDIHTFDSEKLILEKSIKDAEDAKAAEERAKALEEQQRINAETELRAKAQEKSNKDNKSKQNNSGTSNSSSSNNRGSSSNNDSGCVGGDALFN